MQNVDGAKKHLSEHQSYPATCADLVKECDNLSDFSEEDKMWFKQNLPHGQYQSADDVTKAVGWAQ